MDEMFKKARAEGRKEPREAYAFDAFVELARRAAPVTTAEHESAARVQNRRRRTPRLLVTRS